MDKKRYLMLGFIYILILSMLFILIKFLGIKNKVIKYIEFNTLNFNFQDFLSISITILAILVGAIITVATILISMCDKRILKLISKYKKTKYLISSIKVSISSGIITTCLLAIIYSRLDFNLLIFRLILLFLSGYTFLIFIDRSKLLLELVLQLLNDSFENDDSISIKARFKEKK